MYADYTTHTSSAEDPYVPEHKLNCDINSIELWLTANKLTRNVKKTKYIIRENNFKLSQIYDDFTVKVHNTPLDRVNKYKYLGLYIDKNS